jgi:hypothetical protein
MSKHIARQIHTGIGIETTRGTAVAPTFWLPRTEYKNDDKVQLVVDESSIGVIEDAQNADVTQQFAEGEIGGRIDTESIGAILKLAIGSVVSTAVSGQAGAYDHVFNTLQSAQHPTFTLCVKDPNTGVNSLSYALGAIQELELNSEINKYCEYKFKFRANSKTATTVATASYPATQKIFLPQTATIQLGDTLNFTGVPAIEVKKLTLNIKKNIEDDQILGNVAATDRLNKQFSLDGSFEMITNDASYRDLLLNNTPKTAQIVLSNATTIGVSTTSSIIIVLNKIELDEVANKVDNNGFAMHTVKFKAYYKTADAKMLQVTVRNTTASY